MDLRIQQLNPTVGAFRENVASILDALGQAEKKQIDLLILPELAVCGYPPMDLLERSDFREQIYEANRQIVERVQNTGLIFGTVTPNESGQGRTCFNSALLAHNGGIVDTIHKTLLPTYDVFDELRYFEPNNSFRCVDWNGKKLGLTICEDIWFNQNEIQYHNYAINPMQELIDLGAEAIVNLSASPYYKNKPAERTELICQEAKRYGVPIFYANQTGANTELIFDGDSKAVSPDKGVVAQASLFKEDFVDVAWKEQHVEAAPHTSTQIKPANPVAQMFDALVCGLGDYLQKTKIADDVVVGLSGGIDSALVACIAVEALGAEHVTGITMPSEFSSSGSVDDSQILANNLDIELHHIAIKDIYEQFNATLQPLFERTSFDVAEENLQTRIRGILLMAYSNKFGPMLLNTGNKSELATGYCTLYGDMAGGLGVLSDIYKTEVYAIVNWLNKKYYEEEMIPEAILAKPPSAELRPEQKDSDSLPDYEILDPILEAYLERQSGVNEIVELGYEEPIVKQVLNLVDRMEFKRFQAVPGLKVSLKAFGTGRRWPLVERWSPNR